MITLTREHLRFTQEKGYLNEIGINKVGPLFIKIDKWDYIKKRIFLQEVS